ncbi:MAG: adenylate kinase [Bacteroidales bacterium]|jgi:adenylate kinase|nr:adenylate kinase [Bacteroidales bacterium]
MLNLILLGPPGSGKGTQAEFIVDTFELNHISTGNCLRKEIAEQTELGKKVQDIMAAGHLVGDEIVNAIIANHIKNNIEAKGFLFDGYPRTIAQAEYLDQFLAELDIPIVSAINLDVPDEELVRRIVYRGQASGREDDNEETAWERINEYNRKTKPLIDFYTHQDKVEHLHGVRTITETNNLVKKIIENL